MFIEDIARVCHEVNRAYCESLGDFSQLPWESAPDWQKKSACLGVQFHFDHPHAPASASHEEWLKEKTATGWVYGPTKDPEKKQHPCMVPFAELPRDQQTKDFLFKAVCAALHTA